MEGIPKSRMTTVQGCGGMSKMADLQNSVKAGKEFWSPKRNHKSVAAIPASEEEVASGRCRTILKKTGFLEEKR